MWVLGMEPRSSGSSQNSRLSHHFHPKRYHFEHYPSICFVSFLSQYFSGSGYYYTQLLSSFITACCWNLSSLHLGQPHIVPWQATFVLFWVSCRLVASVRFLAQAIFPLQPPLARGKAASSHCPSAMALCKYRLACHPTNTVVCHWPQHPVSPEKCVR